MSASFGKQNQDLNCRTLACNGKIILDDECNLITHDMKITGNLIVKGTSTGTGGAGGGAGYQSSHVLNIPPSSTYLPTTSAVGQTFYYGLPYGTILFSGPVGSDYTFTTSSYSYSGGLVDIQEVTDFDLPPIAVAPIIGSFTTPNYSGIGPVIIQTTVTPTVTPSIWYLHSGTGNSTWLNDIHISQNL